MVTVYSATYSGVPVYEFPIQGVAVMRRVGDGWVNATHILKVADFEKPQRTRILEREVQAGTHEKVQGGYGKYQGTWIPLERAKELAEEYKVADALAPLFDFKETDERPPPAPKHSNKSRTVGAAGAGANGSPKRARKVSSMGEERPIKRKRGRPPSSKSAPLNLAMTPGSVGGGMSGQGALGTHAQSKPSGSMGGVVDHMQHAPAHNHAGGQYYQPGHSHSNSFSSYQIPVVRRRPSITPSSPSADSASISLRSSSPSERFMSDSDIEAALNPSHIRRRYSEDDGYDDQEAISIEYSNKLLDYFLAPDEDQIPEFIVNPPAGFKINQPIDDEGHTTFHWACAMGHIKIIELLLNTGADQTALNDLKQTPLIRSIVFTNNFDRRTFPKVVDLLRNTILSIDDQKRTILHHIALTATSRSKFAATRYYAEIILAKLSEAPEAQQMNTVLNFINRQDVDGNTALHIAAKNGARKLVRVLVSYNASLDLRNVDGRTAQDYIFEMEATRVRDGHGISSSPSQYDPNKLLSSTPGRIHNDDNAGRLSASSAPTLAAQSAGHASYHVSSTAKKVAQRGSELAACFDALAVSYDTQIKDTNAMIDQVRKALNDVEQKAKSTSESIKSLQDKLGSEQEVSQKLRQSNEAVMARALQLGKLVERTQARDLASLVQQNEIEIQDELQRMMESDPEKYTLAERIALAQELAALQRGRLLLVNEVIDLCTTAGQGEKMNEYRKLVSLSCGVKLEDIDELLDGIEQALSEAPA